MKVGDENRRFIESSWHPEKLSLESWERTTLVMFGGKWKQTPFLLVVEDGNTESLHCGQKPLLMDNHSFLLGSFCSASNIKKGLSD